MQRNLREMEEFVGNDFLLQSFLSETKWKISLVTNEKGQNEVETLGLSVYISQVSFKTF